MGHVWTGAKTYSDITWSNIFHIPISHNTKRHEARETDPVQVPSLLTANGLHLAMRSVEITGHHTPLAGRMELPSPYAFLAKDCSQDDHGSCVSSDFLALAASGNANRAEAIKQSDHW